MSKELYTINNTGKNQDKDLSITEFKASDKTMIQVTQGIGSIDEPGFIQLSEHDAMSLIGELSIWVKNLRDKRIVNTNHNHLHDPNFKPYS